MQRDYSMKMKHSDMPLLMSHIQIHQAASPHSLPDKHTQDTVTGTVADHLKRFLYTQESADPIKILPPTVRDYSSLDSVR